MSDPERRDAESVRVSEFWWQVAKRSPKIGWESLKTSRGIVATILFALMLFAGIEVPSNLAAKTWCVTCLFVFVLGYQFITSVNDVLARRERECESLRQQVAELQETIVELSKPAEDDLSECELAVMRAADGAGSVRAVQIAEYGGDVIMTAGALVAFDGNPVYRHVLDDLGERGFLSTGERNHRPTEKWQTYKNSRGWQ